MRTATGGTAARIPNRITLVIRPVCGRKAFSNVDLKPNHWYRGKSCEGKPESVMYLREARARNERVKP